MPVTHQDIADKLGLSRTIVTQALHGTRSSRVSVETQREVQRIARQLGYRPRNVTTHTIGLASSFVSMIGEVDSTFVANVEQALRRRGYRLALFGTQGEHSETIQEIINAKTVDGVLIGEWQNGFVRSNLPPNLPFVVVSDEDGVDQTCDLVAVDIAQTFERIVNYLIEFGHRRLALMTSNLASKFYRRMWESAQQAVAGCGVRGASLQVVQDEMNAMTARVLNLMRSANAPTAIIVADLWRATPVLYTLRSAGYRVPEDVSVISYADSYQFQLLQPVMTVTDQFRPELAEVAVERLLQKICEPESEPVHTLIAGNIVERESVGPPRAA